MMVVLQRAMWKRYWNPPVAHTEESDTTYQGYPYPPPPPHPPTKRAKPSLTATHACNVISSQWPQAPTTPKHMYVVWSELSLATPMMGVLMPGLLKAPPEPKIRWE